MVGFERSTVRHVVLIPEYLDWTSVKAVDTFLSIVCRASNRTFVGRPLCESASTAVLELLSDSNQ